MRAPKKFGGGRGTTYWEPPDEEWLSLHYVVLDKSVRQISREIKASRAVVERWLGEGRFPRRTQAETHRRHARAMTGRVGSESSNWKGGKGRRYGRKVLRRAEVLQACAWCGQNGSGPSKLEVHHKDHNSQNNILENLMYLCQACHWLELGLWHLREQDKIDLIAIGSEIHVTFRR